MRTKVVIFIKKQKKTSLKNAEKYFIPKNKNILYKKAQKNKKITYLCTLKKASDLPELIIFICNT
jgi:hypothetical protein